MHRSEITIDLGALRRNVRTLLRTLDGARLCAVVKADGYGHGATDVAGAALGAGATGHCVATIPGGPALRNEYRTERIVVFGPATEQYTHLTRHAANSAAALRLPESHFDAVRCGGAIYGLSPFNTDPQEDGLEPVLSWQTTLAQVKRLEPGQSTGYGRRFVADAPTWIGIVPVGYGDGFRRDLTGTEVRVAGEPRPGVGTVSVDAF